MAILVSLISTETVDFVVAIITGRCLQSLPGHVTFLALFNRDRPNSLKLWLRCFPKQYHIRIRRVEVLEVQRVVNLVFYFDCFPKAKVIVPLFQCIEVNVLIVFDKRSSLSLYRRSVLAIFCSSSPTAESCELLAVSSTSETYLVFWNL